MLDISRRSLLLGLASSSISGGLSGCGIFVRPLTAYCPTDPRITNDELPLTIDTHAHVFNGTDLQVKAFFQRVLTRDNPSLNVIGDLLETLAWKAAPTGDQEETRLRRISGTLIRCEKRPVTVPFADDRQRQYTEGRLELRSALRNNRSLLASTDRSASGLRDIIDNLPQDYTRYQDQKHNQLRALAKSDAVSGAIDFILRNFQYRYVNVFDYLFTYSVSETRKIDLIVPHLVDYDWPIAEGDPTLTSFEDQIRVMEKISILTGGRVHCFAPFDPMKQVAFDLGYPTENPMAFVRKAVEEQGFVGVKLYPPMGFAPYGNSNLDPKLWNQIWLPDALRRSDLGARLDGALSDLYEWCLNEDVPLMAHTSASNSPSEKYYRFTDADHWKTQSGLPSGLRVSFGHFGASRVVENQSERAREYANLMTSRHGSHGQFFYADSGFFVEALDRKQGLTKALRRLYRGTANAGSAALAQRLMYGTDWEMIVALGRDTRDYSDQFQEIYSELDRDSSLGAIGGRLSDRFFGLNAADFLGLHIGGGNRKRLDAFYSRHRIPKPAWMKKVDAPRTQAVLSAT